MANPVPSFNHLVLTMRQKQYQLFTKPWELNIVGVRSKSVRSNAFDDSLFVFYRDENQRWQLKGYAVTTDPGTYFLDNPLHEQGTALLKAGQYRSAYALGKHRGKYEALVQQKPVTVLRQYKRRGLPRWQNGRPDTGRFGINIHRASQLGTSLEVDKWSAGCTVFANGKDFKEFIELCKRHKRHHGNHFTYTLIDRRAIHRAVTGRVLAGVSLGLLGTFSLTRN